MCKSRVYQLTHPSNQVRDLRVGRSMQMIAWERKTMRFYTQFLGSRLINNNNKTDLEERSKGVRSPLVKSKRCSVRAWDGKGSRLSGQLALIDVTTALPSTLSWLGLCRMPPEDPGWHDNGEGMHMDPPGCPLLWPSSLRWGRQSPLCDLYGQILGLGSSSLQNQRWETGWRMAPRMQTRQRTLYPWCHSTQAMAQWNPWGWHPVPRKHGEILN